MRQAAARVGIQRLQDTADSVIVIPCDGLGGRDRGYETEAEPYLQVDEMLSDGVRLTSDMLAVPGLLCLDFQDVREVLRHRGICVMGTAISSGENRAVQAMEQAMAHPLIDAPLDEAPGILVNVTGGLDMGLYEINEALTILNHTLDREAKMIAAAVLDESMGERMRITFAATGYPSELLWPERLTMAIGIPIELCVATATEVV